MLEFSVGSRCDMANYDEIKTTIFKYFDGVREANRQLLEEAFAADEAHMKGYLLEDDGNYQLNVRPIPEVIDDWASRSPSPEMQGKIIAINIFSDIAATALFDFNGIYVDSFQLAKIGGQWKIVNKFYISK
jgi:hypothetical protein